MTEDQDLRQIAMHIARDIAVNAAINLDQPNPDAVIRAAASITAFIKDGTVPNEEKTDG